MYGVFTARECTGCVRGVYGVCTGCVRGVFMILWALFIGCVWCVYDVSCV